MEVDGKHRSFIFYLKNMWSFIQYLLDVFSSFSKKIDESQSTIQTELVYNLNVIVTFFRITPKIVFYPWSWNDISPKKAFPRAKIFFVDGNKKYIEWLRAAGCTYSICKKPHAFKLPHWADMTLLFDIPFHEQFLKNTKRGALIVCNDHYGAATELYGRKDAEIVWVLTEDGVDDTSLFEYFQSADNDADLRRAWVYHLYRKSVEKIDPEIEDVMAFIRKDYQKVMWTDTYLGVALSVAKGDVGKVLPKKRGDRDSASGFTSISNLCIFRKI